ncbi:hypothetical protein Asppvi_002153 [Aspergillus pseudoviridinutans]|uniref:Uncharacterized protein n=1 Tax=Aspergillus pseudoviridinutans TaxID=1517512 RepID=A0A9P3EQ15_9EURO|nr:uncharacterized protein Asppvi_002153 [Aspergillus pseudoviridinutans]GIJ83334.1 hypothetical protein Asppvi_002153 [Aspergillus pseudoviridinutans]
MRRDRGATPNNKLLFHASRQRAAHRDNGHKGIVRRVQRQWDDWSSILGPIGLKNNGTPFVEYLKTDCYGDAIRQFNNVLANLVKNKAGKGKTEEDALE